MDADTHNEGSKINGNDSPVKENGYHQPVLPDTSGVGHPYAPENFPNPGDKWRWRVGKRVAVTGHYLDRYLYAPKSLKHLFDKKFPENRFASKLSLQRFIETQFPDVDAAAFFASFSWRIPSKKLPLVNGSPDRHTFSISSHKESPEPSSSEPGLAGCKARNRTCISLISKTKEPALPLMPCDICCSEQAFCRECCCILCSKTVDPSHKGYSFIRCEALVGEGGSMCGHLAHLNCGLRSYMAGTVGGSIGLDAEYYCRRCDSRTELVSHVTKLMEACKSIDSRDEVEVVLNMGFSILCGSKRTSANKLLGRIDSALSKLKLGNSLQEIWKGDNSLADGNGTNFKPPKENGNLCRRVSDNKSLPDAIKQKRDQANESDSSSSRTHCQKLESRVIEVLQAMRRAQETEYRIAEERLHDQKNYLLSLYQQLDQISELRKRGTSNYMGDVPKTLLEIKDQIKRENKKLSEMMEVAKGFGMTSKEILKEYYSLGWK